MIIVEDDIYVKDPSFPHEDNWVWSPQGEIAMHLPERWGFLQFSEVREMRDKLTDSMRDLLCPGSS